MQLIKIIHEPTLIQQMNIVIVIYFSLLYKTERNLITTQIVVRKGHNLEKTLLTK